MRNPYIVGRWLRGADHYGRQKLIEHLLTTSDQAIWLVGTRRMGKTSLLRQLEWVIEQDPQSTLVPLFWDIQACESAEDLAYEMFISIEDETDRFERLGIDIASLQAMDANRILRSLQRALSSQGKQLLLLIDEAEALINVAKNDNRELARLRRTLQQGEHRTILTATKQLMHLNELMRDWLTSPFLFGFNLVNLWSLDIDAAQSLVRQEQNETEIVVDQRVMEEVIVYTHRHPYLTQYLCLRLFELDENGVGRLRPVESDDLQADHLLSGFFQIDYDHLSPTERQILLAIARHGVVDSESVAAELAISSPATLERFIYGMNKLGYLRQILGGWSIGNEFLRRWVLENQNDLARQLLSRVSDEGVEALLVEGRRFELDYLRNEVSLLQQRQEDQLARRAAYGEDVPLELSQALLQTRREIEVARQQIHLLSTDPATAPVPA
ncbi:MAG: ATP-binding protein [Caldilineaceae bacterium]|nr:ATP-binding protein [Caldilineaceae bacterium]HRJ43374.1 AAA family ATPase [Caldilineaceae bacterium]